MIADKIKQEPRPGMDLKLFRRAARYGTSADEPAEDGCIFALAAFTALALILFIGLAA